MSNNDLASRPHTLYRFFDAQNRLLYVGVTCNAFNRWSRHAGDKPWWPQVARTTVEHFPDRQSVLTAETLAIKAEKPKYNIRKVNTSASEPKVRPEPDRTSLVGAFCHSRADRGWQGQIIAEPAPGVYRVQLFEWILGMPSAQVLVWLEDMKGWQFYDNADDWTWAYEHGGVHERWDREREEAS